MSDSEIADTLSPDTLEGPDTGSLNAKKIKINNTTRAIENSRFIGAPAQAGYYYSNLTTNITGDHLTANLQIGGIIGSGFGFIAGYLLDYILRSTNSYRVGSHQLLYIDKKPDKSLITQLSKNVSANAAYIRFKNELYYYNKIINTLSDDPIATFAANGELRATAIESNKPITVSTESLELDSKSVKPGIKIRNLTDQEVSELARIPNEIFCSGRTSTNPFYRNFKVLANFGWQVGAVVVMALGIQDNNKKRIMAGLFSDIFCLVFGLLAFPYWLIREKLLKIPAGSAHQYGITGIEGWSKYARTALAFGTSLGTVIGGILAAGLKHASTSAVSLSINFWGGIVGISSFAAGLILVPVINWVTSKFRKNQRGILAAPELPANADDVQTNKKKYNKDWYRNNYTRSGMTLGGGVGALLGIALGRFVFTPILAGNIFAAAFSVIFGILLSVFGHDIYKKLHPKTEVQDTENSWDYVTRSTANVFGFVGAAIACIISPGSALLVLPVGTAIGGLVGWIAGLGVMWVARKVSPLEKPADTAPWTQRITTGTNIGSIVGGTLGIALAFVGVFSGPVGMVLAISLVGAIGAIIGAAVGVLADQKGRDMVCDGLKYILGFKIDKDNKAERVHDYLSTPSQPLINPVETVPVASSSTASSIQQLANNPPSSVNANNNSTPAASVKTLEKQLLPTNLSLQLNQPIEDRSPLLSRNLCI